MRERAKERVLVIDDDVEFLNLAQTWLDNAGYEALTAEDGIAGLRRVHSSRPNLVLLDANMPAMDGWEVCCRIRDMSEIPVIMVTVNGQMSDLLRGFDLGADDYVTKPVDFAELMARVQAVLRRSDTAMQEEGPSTFHSGDVEVDWRSRQVHVRGKSVKLSPTEFKVLPHQEPWLDSHPRAAPAESMGAELCWRQILRKAVHQISAPEN